MRKSIEARGIANERRENERKRSSARSNARYVKRAGFSAANAAFRISVKVGI